MGKDKLIRKKKREKTKNSHNYDDNKITRKYKRLKRKAAKNGMFRCFFCLDIKILYLNIIYEEGYL
jgi:hypothetical protein